MNQISSFLIDNLPAKSFMWSAFYAALVIFAIVSAFLIYHWYMYTTKPDKPRIRKVQVIYFSAAAALFLVMLAAVIKYPQ